MVVKLYVQPLIVYVYGLTCRRIISASYGTSWTLSTGCRLVSESPHPRAGELKPTSVVDTAQSKAWLSRPVIPNHKR